MWWLPAHCRTNSNSIARKIGSTLRTVKEATIFISKINQGSLLKTLIEFDVNNCLAEGVYAKNEKDGAYGNHSYTYWRLKPHIVALFTLTERNRILCPPANRNPFLVSTYCDLRNNGLLENNG